MASHFEKEQFELRQIIETDIIWTKILEKKTYPRKLHEISIVLSLFAQRERYGTFHDIVRWFRFAWKYNTCRKL